MVGLAGRLDRLLHYFMDVMVTHCSERHRVLTIRGLICFYHLNLLNIAGHPMTLITLDGEDKHLLCQVVIVTEL